jgi:hypothetical protein
MSSPVRDWAKAQGYDVGDRGRLPDWVVLAYEESKSEPQVETDPDDQLWVQVNIPGATVEVEEVACQMLLGILIASGLGGQS